MSAKEKKDKQGGQGCVGDSGGESWAGAEARRKV